jgi:hypothetical protein
MSSEDKVSPYHARSGSETADTLADVLEHAAAREQAAHKRAAPKKQPKWMLPLGINLGVFAVYLLIAPPAWVIVDPIEGPPVAAQTESLRLGMYMQIQRIDAYRLANGRLPDVLEDAGSVVVSGAEYRRMGVDQYQLVASVGDSVVIYDSTESANDFVGDAANRLRGG